MCVCFFGGGQVGNRLGEELLCQLGHAYEGAVGRQRKPLVPPSVA